MKSEKAGLKIEMLSETVHTAEETAEILAVHPMQHEGKGIIGSLNYCWQVWKLEASGQLRITHYRGRLIDGYDRKAFVKALAAVTFSTGILKARKGYSESWEVV